MKKNKKTITVSIAIAAYNAERNIKRLVESILKQKQVNYKIDKVIVNSDSSTDNTVKITRNIKNKVIKVIDSRARAGFAGTLVSLVKKNDADILIILNDDIVIRDKLFLEKTIQRFINEKNVGLVCCNIHPFNSANFIAKSIKSGFNAYKKTGEFFKNGNNAFTCDGKALCLSKAFIRSLKFPKDLSDMGNVDTYIYLYCIKNKFKYRYAKEGILYFKFPSTISDFVKWQIRNYKNRQYILKKTFGSLVEKEYKKPINIFNKFRIIEFLKNPFGSIFIFITGIYCSYKAKLDSNEFNITWDSVQTTKDL